jgi:hypothetical protein
VLQGKPGGAEPGIDLVASGKDLHYYIIKISMKVKPFYSKTFPA